MALNTLVDSILPESEISVGLKGLYLVLAQVKWLAGKIVSQVTYSVLSRMLIAAVCVPVMFCFIK